jgi:6,7-dimethyl-8-ribityllumazine synthase
MSNRDIDSTSENVLHDWAREPEPAEPEASEEEPDESGAPAEDGAAWGAATLDEDPEHSVAVELGDDVEPAELDEPSEPEDANVVESEPGDAGMIEEALVVELSHEHAAGDLHIPDGYAVLEGVSEGGRRAVGVVVSRFNGTITTQLLDGALSELAGAGVRQEAITIMVVPGAFELPLAATALAKTRRFACIVALGCIIRGDTPHFDYVSSEAASGLQLAALETGVPVSFGVLTLDRVDQAEARVGKGAEAVRSALEMADLFAHLRAAAAAH